MVKSVGEVIPKDMLEIITSFCSDPSVGEETRKLYATLKERSDIPDCIASKYDWDSHYSFGVQLDTGRGDQGTEPAIAFAGLNPEGHLRVMIYFRDIYCWTPGFMPASTNGNLLKKDLMNWMAHFMAATFEGSLVMHTSDKKAQIVLLKEKCVRVCYHVMARHCARNQITVLMELDCFPCTKDVLSHIGRGVMDSNYTAVMGPMGQEEEEGKDTRDITQFLLGWLAQKEKAISAAAAPGAGEKVVERPQELGGKDAEGDCVLPEVSCLL